MKDLHFEAQLVAATTRRSDDTNNFVKDTMKKITKHSTINALPTRKKSIFTWIGHLHRPVLAAIAVLVLALASGIVYAAVQFAPALLQILGKETNRRGATEYSVAGFEDCARKGQPTANRFEINSQAPKLTDDEIKKILQAKCELQWINKFVETTWPTYGTNPQWKDGDTIYYTRTDVLGKVATVRPQEVSLRDNYGSSFNYKTVDNATLKAYQNGTEIPLGNIKAGDSVFSIVRVSETYHEHNVPLRNKQNNIPYHDSRDNNMHVVGLIALFKLSLPDEYYGKMQSYITEVPKCLGNESEYCVSVPSIDVYPRNNGEGSSNPYLKQSEDKVYHEISGTVTKLTADSLTLTSRMGNTYTVTVGDNGFAVYNSKYAGAYEQLDAKLKVGSNVAIRYLQPKGADPHNINKDQVSAVVLVLEALNPKSSNVKQY